MSIKRAVALSKKYFVTFLLRQLFSFLRLVPRRRRGLVLEMIIQAIAEHFAHMKEGFVRYSISPYVGTHATFNGKKFPTTAIVISGKYEWNFDFTYNTLRMLRQLHPEVRIIYSGWEEVLPIRDLLQSLGVHVVISATPQTKDVFNVIKQATAARAGLIEAEQLGLQFAVRMRSDQRFLNPNTLSYLHSLLTEFQSEENGTKLESRIVSISDCLSTFAIDHYPDHFHFGKIKDLLLYWEVPNIDGLTVPNDLEKMNVFLDSRIYAEQILGREFVKRALISPANSVEEYWEALGKYWIIIERRDIDLFWIKYSWWLQERGDHFDAYLHYPYVKKIHATSNIHKEQWLELHQHNFIPIPFSIENIRKKFTIDVLVDNQNFKKIENHRM